MRFVTFNIDCAKRPGGTKVFAGSAADAFALVNGGYLDGHALVVVIDHLDGAGRAVASAVATADTVGEHYAVVLYPYGMSHVDGGLLLFRDGLDGTSRTHLATTGALGTAVTRFKRHGGLHETGQVGRWT